MNTSDDLQLIRYDRSLVRPGVIHLGVGAFHRAHQAEYLDSLLQYQSDWAICGINLRAEDRTHFNALKDQNGLYVLKTISPEGETKYREIGSIVELLDASDNYGQAVDRALDPAIRIVSMTVTESGYYLDDHNILDLDALPIQQGITSGQGSSVYAFLHAVVRARRLHSVGPITFLCCDNLRDNGGKLKVGLGQYLEATGDADSIDWVRDHVTFPCSMVDRITPRIDSVHSEDVLHRFGYHDNVTVMGESFIQWVIEDQFANGRPLFQNINVDIVKDVEPYEDAKIRLLNGGHTILAYLAALKGYVTYHAGITDPELRAFFRAYETDEVIPAIGESPINLELYRDVIESRFSNQYIADTVERICMDGVSKFPIFVLPTIKGLVDLGQLPKLSIYGIASWYIFMRQVEAGRIIFPYIEPKWHWIRPYLVAGQEEAFAKLADLWGDIPTRCPEFVSTLVADIRTLGLQYSVRPEVVEQ